MSDDKWAMHFLQFRTRTEVRGTLTSLMEPGSSQTVFPAEIGTLATGNDREALERMRQLTAEPIKRDSIFPAVRLVRRA
jgi:hypothetical protein